MTLAELEKRPEQFISPKLAAEVSGDTEHNIRYRIQAAWRETGGEMDKVRERLGYNAQMNGRNARIWRKSFIKYVKRMEE